MLSSLAQFLFILVIPLVLVAGGLVTLFVLGAAFDAHENPKDISARIDSLFRRPPQAPKDTAPDHYYQPHWKQEKSA